MTLAPLGNASEGPCGKTWAPLQLIWISRCLLPLQPFLVLFLERLGCLGVPWLVFFEASPLGLFDTDVGDRVPSGLRPWPAWLWATQRGAGSLKFRVFFQLVPFGGGGQWGNLAPNVYEHPGACPGLDPRESFRTPRSHWQKGRVASLADEGTFLRANTCGVGQLCICEPLPLGPIHDLRENESYQVKVLRASGKTSEGFWLGLGKPARCFLVFFSGFDLRLPNTCYLL